MMGVRHFLSLEDLSLDELWAVLDLAASVKATPEKYAHALNGKSLAMIFQKKSTRTRVSFETGMFQLGGMALFLGASDIQIGRGESIADTARVISRYNSMIMARVYGHDVLEEMAAHATVPVINGLSDALHPCQVLADLQTMRERFGDIRGLTFTYVGDGNNMAHSLMLGCARAGVNVRIAAPSGYEPDAAYVAAARSHGQVTGAEVLVLNDPAAAVADSHVVYTDVWASMGQEEEQAQRLIDFEGFQVNGRLMSAANSDAIFMHCLPAHRGEEVSAEVCDGPQSVIFDEAENRLHAQKALMLFLLGAG